jgi:flagellar protein FliS
LAGGDIAARSGSISKACQLIGELAGALDAQRGGEIAARLAQLYDYILRRLLEANLRQKDEPLAEVLSLLVTLGEGWEGIRSAPRAAEPVPQSVWAQAPQDASPRAQAWSL